MPGNYHVGEDYEGFLCLRTSAGNRTALGVMEIAAPAALTGDFARIMMSFLLFMEKPQDILMAGLGAGTMAKYILKNLPATHLTAVEIDAEMIDIARAHFHVPPDSERFKAVAADILEYLPNHPSSCDVILSDVFDDDVVPAELMTADYYAACHRALRRDGMLVINLMQLKLNAFTEQIALLQKIFQGGVLAFPLVQQYNIILFCFRDRHFASWKTLEERARRLEPQFGLNLPDLVKGMMIRSALLHDFMATPPASITGNHSMTPADGRH